MSKKRTGSKRRNATCFSLARLQQHVSGQREDFQNKLTAEIYKENDLLTLEKLKVEKMLRNHSLAKSITDASFSKFIRKAVFEAEMLRKHFIVVDPWGITQSATTA